jgi:hypothetical protein
VMTVAAGQRHSALSGKQTPTLGKVGSAQDLLLIER